MVNHREGIERAIAVFKVEGLIPAGERVSPAYISSFVEAVFEAKQLSDAECARLTAQIETVLYPMERIILVAYLAGVMISDMVSSLAAALADESLPR